MTIEGFAQAIIGKNLDKLVNNIDYKVRVIVAEKEYGLDILINDENPFMRVYVIYYCKMNGDKLQCR